MESEKKSDPRIIVRMTDDQKKEIEKQAGICGISVSEFCKRRLLSMPPQDTIYIHDIALSLGELKLSIARTECRINDIVQACYGSNTISESNYQELTDLLNQIVESYKDLIQKTGLDNQPGEPESADREDRDEERRNDSERKKLKYEAPPDGVW